MVVAPKAVLQVFSRYGLHWILTLARRTEALGEMRLCCERCGQQNRLFHACRDRHCPRRQRRASHGQRGHTLCDAERRGSDSVWSDAGNRQEIG